MAIAKNTSPESGWQAAIKDIKLQIDVLEKRIDNIQLIPGPIGPQGEQGLPGVDGKQMKLGEFTSASYDLPYDFPPQSVDGFVVLSGGQDGYDGQLVCEIDGNTIAYHGGDQLSITIPLAKGKTLHLSSNHIEEKVYVSWIPLESI